MKLLAILFTIFIIFAIVVVVAWIFVEVFKDYLKYEDKMIYLENFINDCDVSPENYDFLFNEFMEMKDSTYCNKQRTAELFEVFIKKFKL